MRKYYVFTAAAFILLSGCAEKAQYSIQSVSETPVSSVEEDHDTEAQEEGIVVYVCGEVNSPGVYELPSDSRIYEALEEAGGLKEGVDTTKINMAQKLADGQQITVLAEGLADQEGAEPKNRKVNLNTADKEELMTLSGIGESRAEDILKYREQYGGFSSVEDILNISGIGEKMFEKIKDDIEV